MLVTACQSRGGGGCTPPPVEVEVSDAAGPVEGALVLRHDSHGEFVSAKETGADGTVSFKADTDDLLTAVRVVVTAESFEFHDVHTIGGVHPGDSLYFHFPETYTSPGGAVASVGLSLEGTGFPGGDTYLVGLAECPGAIGAVNGSAGGVTVPVGEECAGTDFTPYGWVQTSDGTLAAFQLEEPLPLTALENDGATLAGPWRTDWTDVPLALTGIPDGTWGYNLRDDLFDAAGRPVWSGGTGGATTNPVPPSFVRLPIDSAAVSESTLLVLGTDGEIQLANRGPIPASFDVDVATELPAYLSSATLAPSGTSVEFTWSGSPATADYLELSAGYYIGDAVTPKYLLWKVRLPPGPAGVFRLPEWPSELAGLYAPPEDAAEILQRYVRSVDAEFAGWFEARRHDPRDEPETWQRVHVKRTPDVP